MSIRSVHSARTVFTQRSAKAFIRGACGAVFMISTPMEVNTASKASVKRLSRSRIKWLNWLPRDGAEKSVPAGHRLVKLIADQ